MKRSLAMMTLVMLMETNAAVELAQLDWRAMVGDLIQLGFAVCVAWYLLTKTTQAIEKLTSEIGMLRKDVERLIHVVEREGRDTRQELEARRALDTRTPRRT